MQKKLRNSLGNGKLLFLFISIGNWFLLLLSVLLAFASPFYTLADLQVVILLCLCVCLSLTGSAYSPVFSKINYFLRNGRKRSSFFCIFSVLGSVALFRMFYVYLLCVLGMYIVCIECLISQHPSIPYHTYIKDCAESTTQIFLICRFLFLSRVRTHTHTQ